MLSPYRDVLTVPGTAAFVAAGALARLPIAMLAIGIVLLVEGGTGSYGLAGAVAAVYGIVQSLAAPAIGQAVDRFGQSRVMRPAVAVHVLGILLLVLSVEAGLPLWTTFAAAVLAGATIGSIGALVRARWSHVLSGRRDGARLLHTAYSLESVLDELVFITGPLLVTVLATEVSPAAGLLAAAVAVSAGGATLLAQRRSEPPPSGVRPVRGSAVLGSAGMVVLLVAFFFTGGIFGAVEVTTVAFAEEQGTPSLAGPVLAVFALGSLLAGLAYGTVHWTSPPGRRFVLGVLLLAVGVFPVMLVERTWLLTLVVFVAGFAISPMIISGMALVQILVVPTRLTEGLTWVSTAIALGAAAGAAVSGAAIDAVGAHRAFVIPVVAGAAATAVVLLGARWLDREPVRVASARP